MESRRFNFSTGFSYFYKDITIDNNNNGYYDTGDTVLYRKNFDGNAVLIQTTGYHWDGDPFVGEYVKELPPIVLDLDGSGIRQSVTRAEFDVDGDGQADSVGWISGGQAFLALDRNGNGAIDNGSEISFIADLPGASSDLEGLAAYDSNGDGRFDASDARFHDFLVWQDANEDGVSQAGELKSLDAAGIASIGLAITPASPLDEGGQAILGLSTFTRTDGSIGAVGDVALRWEHIEHAMDEAAEPISALPADARLAIDLDGNGVVDSPGETFTLNQAARFDSNGDGKITSADSSYFDLRLWTDSNHDGSAALLELRGLDGAGLTSILLPPGHAGTATSPGPGSPPANDQASPPILASNQPPPASPPASPPDPVHAHDVRLGRMIQAMAVFGDHSGVHDLLRQNQQSHHFSGYDWYHSSAA
jgi:hypothetical protein